MQITVSRSLVSGNIGANPSKSYTQRAYALASLASSKSEIRDPSWSDDGCAALGVARAMGADLEIVDASRVVLRPNSTGTSLKWYVGESGLSLRMFSPIAALSGNPVTIDGHGSLKRRPVAFIKSALAQMGVELEGDGLPISIRGPIQPGEYRIDGSMSSQLITGLLISLPLTSGPSTLQVDDLRSTPYIDMTLELIKRFGGNIDNKLYETFDIDGDQIYSGIDYRVEADWSGIAFPLVAGAIAGDVTISNVTLESLQADSVIIDILDMAGAVIDIAADTIRVRKSDLTAFEYDATNCPDLFPPLAILAARCEGITRIRGVHRLKHKESDRAIVLQDEFAKLGVQISIDRDEMIIVGLQQVNGGAVDAHGDHRIAMAMTLAGMVAQRDVTITGAESVAKSYPSFYADMRDLRGRMQGPEELFERRGADYFLQNFTEHHE